MSSVGQFVAECLYQPSNLSHCRAETFQITKYMCSFVADTFYFHYAVIIRDLFSHDIHMLINKGYGHLNFSALMGDLQSVRPSVCLSHKLLNRYRRQHWHIH